MNPRPSSSLLHVTPQCFTPIGSENSAQVFFFLCLTCDGDWRSFFSGGLAIRCAVSALLWLSEAAAAAAAGWDPHHVICSLTNQPLWSCKTSYWMEDVQPCIRYSLKKCVMVQWERQRAVRALRREKSSLDFLSFCQIKLLFLVAWLWIHSWAPLQNNLHDLNIHSFKCLSTLWFI